MRAHTHTVTVRFKQCLIQSKILSAIDILLFCAVWYFSCITLFMILCKQTRANALSTWKVIYFHFIIFFKRNCRIIVAYKLFFSNKIKNRRKSQCCVSTQFCSDPDLGFENSGSGSRSCLNLTSYPNFFL